MGKKNIILLAAAVLVMSSLLFPAAAHPGGTDANGGHTDQDSGEYHYHHGYPAHQHHDMDGDGRPDCPYDFDDKTNYGSDANKTTEGNAATSHPTSQPTQPSKVPQSQTNTEDSFFSELVPEDFEWALTTEYLLIAFISSAVLILSVLARKRTIAKNSLRAAKFYLIIASLSAFVLVPAAIILLYAIIIILQALISIAVILALLWWILRGLKKIFARIYAKHLYANAPTNGEQQKDLQPILNAPPTADNLQSPNSPAHTQPLPLPMNTCVFLWSQVFQFRTDTNSPMDLKRDVCLWTVLFYIFTKTIRKQEFVNKVYAEFSSVTGIALNKGFLPGDSATELSAAVETYKSFAQILNESHIAVTENSLVDLWTFAIHKMPGNYDSLLQYQQVFSECAMQVIDRAKAIRNANVQTQKDRHPETNIQYSLSEPIIDHNTKLPTDE